MEEQLKHKRQGDLGEDMGYWFVKLYIDHIYLSQFDYVIHPKNKTIFESKLNCKLKSNSKWINIEIKHKDPYESGTFSGTGLNEYQVDARMEYYKDNGIRTFLIVFENEKPNIYYQYLDVLEKHREYTSRSRIVVYDYKYFDKMSKKDFFNDVRNEIIKQRKDKNHPHISDEFAKLLGIETMSEYAEEIVHQAKLRAKEQFINKFKKFKL